MKAYTDLEQSKKLAEILPLESADMWWAERYEGRVENYIYIVEENPFYYLSFTKPSEENYSQDTLKDIHCWSLSALLDVVPYLSLHKTFSGWRCDAFNREGTTCKLGRPSDNPVDACVDMIIKLYEQNLL